MYRVTPIVLCLLAIACEPSGEAAPTSQPSLPPPRTEALGEKVSADKFELIADGVVEGPALAVRDVLADPSSYAGKSPLRVEGDIVSVCQNKGCWFRVGDADSNLFVKFVAGCAEFMPKDAAGRTVLVEGELLVEEATVDERKHLLEDQGKHEEAARVTEPKTEVRLIATGAAIKKS